MDLGVGEMGFIFCGQHPPLVTRTRVSDPGHMGPLVKLVWFAKLISEPIHENLELCMRSHP